MNFNLTRIKLAESRNGASMSADFHINGIIVATFIDKGDGSQPDFIFTSHPQAKTLFAEFKSEIESLPPVYVSQYEMNIEIDEFLFIDLLHEAIVKKQNFNLLAA